MIMFTAKNGAQVFFRLRGQKMVINVFLPLSLDEFDDQPIYPSL